MLEYIDAIPSVADLLSLFPVSDDPAAVKVLYSDEGVSIRDESAFVFMPKNDANSFASIGLNELIE